MKNNTLTEPVESDCALPVASCRAAVDDIITSLPVLAVGAVAQWSAGEVIRITGRIALRGYFDSSAVRWKCAARGDCGLFGSGYVAFPLASVAHLPLVK